jgi:crossover junction endodeoxyribonuclease RuvC
MAPIHTPSVPLRILALDPGTHEMGYAVLEGSELIYFGVHTFPRGLPSPALLAEGTRFVTALITTYTPTLCVIEKTGSIQSARTSLLHVLVVELQRTARQQGLHVATYAPTTVKKAITGFGAATKREVARTLIQR